MCLDQAKVAPWPNTDVGDDDLLAVFGYGLGSNLDQSHLRDDDDGDHDHDYEVAAFAVSPTSDITATSSKVLARLTERGRGQGLTSDEDEDTVDSTLDMVFSLTEGCDESRCIPRDDALDIVMITFDMTYSFNETGGRQTMNSDEDMEDTVSLMSKCSYQSTNVPSIICKTTTSWSETKGVGIGL